MSLEDSPSTMKKSPRFQGKLKGLRPPRRLYVPPPPTRPNRNSVGEHVGFWPYYNRHQLTVNTVSPRMLLLGNQVKIGTARRVPGRSPVGL